MPRPGESRGPRRNSPCLDGRGASGDVRNWSEDPLTARSRAIWTGGDYHPIARSYLGATREFVARLSLKPGETVLDVACGTGNACIPAAETGARVTGIDIAPNLIARARQEARDAGVPIVFEVGDAEALCLADHQFATTISMFGAMFAARPDRVTPELLRVTERGGRVAMANWIADGWIGEMRDIHVALGPPPGDLPNPFDWGDAAIVRERLGGLVSALTCARQTMEFRFPFPPAAVTEVFATSYGPTVAMLGGAEPGEASRLRQQITQLFVDHNRADDGTTVLAGAYLDVQARVA